MTKGTTVQSDAELIAASLNEQGYLLQLRLLSLIQTTQSGEEFTPWRTEAVEYPVSTENGEQTRIDIVLAHMKFPNVCLVVECKRANPLYKRWVFFARSIRPNDSFFFDAANDFYRSPDRGLTYSRELKKFPPAVELYTFYVESRQNRPNSTTRSSATNAIEDALQQVTLGQVGLMWKLIQFTHAMQNLPPLPMMTVPVIVTTAQLFGADFGHDGIPLETGEIDPRKLVVTRKPFLAVNFRLNNDVAQLAGLTVAKPTRIGLDLTTQQMRTVFVVQATAMREFLFWVHDKLVDL